MCPAGPTAPYKFLLKTTLQHILQMYQSYKKVLQSEANYEPGLNNQTHANTSTHSRSERLKEFTSELQNTIVTSMKLSNESHQRHQSSKELIMMLGAIGRRSLPRSLKRKNNSLMKTNTGDPRTQRKAMPTCRKHNPQIQGKFCNATNNRGPQEPGQKKSSKLLQ